MKAKIAKTLLSIAASGLWYAGAAQADSAHDALKHFTDGVQTFEAHFDQVQTDDKNRITARSSGHFWLERPIAGGAGAGGIGKFRWAYEKPYTQATICDGAKLWAFDPDLNQVTVRDAKQALAGTPAELLSQKSALISAFNVQDAGASGDDRSVNLTPKSKNSDFKTIELTLDKDGAPVKMRFADQIGGHSEVSFTEVHTNAKIDPAQFQFTPPKGAEIVNDGGITTKSLD